MDAGVTNTVVEILPHFDGFVYPNESGEQPLWGVLIVLYPYITGLVAGAFIMASLVRVFRVKALEPVYRLSLLTALAFLLCAPLPLLFHLGRPERCFQIMITPHFTSAMSGFGFVYAGYTIIVTLEIWFHYRADFVARHAAARGLPGVAPFLGRVGPYRLATRWIEARRLADYSDRSVDDRCFKNLHRVLEGMHERGIAIADLHYRDVLIDARGEVHLVDLATAWLLGRRPGRVRRAIFEHLRQTDLWGLARMRGRFSASGPPARVTEEGRQAARWHRRARRLKWHWDRLRGAPRLRPARFD